MSYRILEVTVIEGRNLKDKNIFGKNDLFIELYLDKDYKQKTTTIKNSNTPVWYETFQL
jgi:Ca2+-dependent lipid-binding protein